MSKDTNVVQPGGQLTYKVGLAQSGSGYQWVEQVNTVVDNRFGDLATDCSPLPREMGFDGAQPLAFRAFCTYTRTINAPVGSSVVNTVTATGTQTRYQDSGGQPPVGPTPWTVAASASVEVVAPAPGKKCKKAKGKKKATKAKKSKKCGNKKKPKK